MTTDTERSERDEISYRREQEYSFMQGVTEKRLGSLETDFAGTRSDIKSLYNMMEKVMKQVDRMSDNMRPNTMGLFLAALGLCTLIATVGVLSFAPVYRNIDAMDHDIDIMALKVDAINGTRYTPDDGKYDREKAEEDLEKNKDDIIAELRSNKAEQSERIYRNERLIIQLIKDTERMKGRFDERGES